MPEFEHIEDPRQRLLARLNLALRSGSAPANSYIADILKSGVSLVDIEREVVAQHLLESLEDELGRKLT